MKRQKRKQMDTNKEKKKWNLKYVKIECILSNRKMTANIIMSLRCRNIRHSSLLCSSALRMKRNRYGLESLEQYYILIRFYKANSFCVFPCIFLASYIRFTFSFYIFCIINVISYPLRQGVCSFVFMSFFLIVFVCACS